MSLYEGVPAVKNGDNAMSYMCKPILLMKSYHGFRMPPCLRAAYVSQYLPIK